MSADEADDTPLTHEHVRDFLKWYQKKAPPQRIDVSYSPVWWWNGLHTLTLGELRNGIRSYQRFPSKLWLSPVEFWGLCKGKADLASIEQFRAMREAVANAPPPKTRKEVKRDDHSKAT